MIREAMIGRSTGVLPLLAKGFQQPDMIIPLAFGITDFQGEWVGENVMLRWKLLGEGTGAHVYVEQATAPHAFRQVGEVALGVPQLLGTDVLGMQQILSLTTTAVGAIAVLCSVMIYVVTRRKWWRGSSTGVKFFGTAAALGFGTMAATTCLTARLFPGVDLSHGFRQLVTWFFMSAREG